MYSAVQCVWREPKGERGMDGGMEVSLPELPEEEADRKAAGVGLKDLMWFLFFGMPGEDAASLK